ncbi:hypothetical protein V491_09069 [Pseudogymnoascus sp. VKM F-3775]|nr:hypothetical protein V491_09069 [Pseudogymnoascus sp. VKM F-3775]
MANRIYTRTYSPRSVGRFISGKGLNGAPLSDTSLLEEFENHSKSGNRQFTALVSASDRIVDGVTRAFRKYYEDGEEAADIWIAFIEVSPTTTARIHSARELAGRCGFQKPELFSHEVVFEWAIPEEYIIHEVSFLTLMERGLREDYFLREYHLPQPSSGKVQSAPEVRSAAEVRHNTAREFQQRRDPWDIGLTLGAFAQNFGAKTPLGWIAHQFFSDCVQSKIRKDRMVMLKYAHEYTDDASWEQHAELVDFDFLLDIDAGIDTALCDWWLSDIEDYEEFEKWRGEMEDSMGWELIKFRETWVEVDEDGIIRVMPASEAVLFDEAWRQLSVKHEKQRAAIKAEGLRIGL